MKQFFTILAVGLATATLAQTKPDFPKLTDAQKAETMAFLSTTVRAGSIAYAKSMGKSPKEYGQAIGRSFLPSWEQAKPNALEHVVGHMNRVAQGFNTPFELVN